MRSFLRLASSIKHPKLPARIIYKAIDPFSDFILIDRGSKDGVQPQMPVLALFGNSAIGLIGQVIEVYPNFSKVMLISDPSFAVDVKVVRTGDRAIVRGKRRAYSIFRIPSALFPSSTKGYRGYLRAGCPCFQQI
jgi:rod shape-determining protein MreC